MEYIDCGIKIYDPVVEKSPILNFAVVKMTVIEFISVDIMVLHYSLHKICIIG